MHARTRAHSETSTVSDVVAEACVYDDTLRRDPSTLSNNFDLIVQPATTVQHIVQHRPSADSDTKPAAVLGARSSSIVSEWPAVESERQRHERLERDRLRRLRVDRDHALEFQYMLWLQL